MTPRQVSPPQPTAVLPQTGSAVRRFNRASRLVFALALGPILFAFAQKAYRLTLPTDGWDFYTGDIGSADQDRPIYAENLLGYPSPLRPDDKLLAVEGQSFEAIYSRAASGQTQPPPDWQAGHTVRYTVERQGQPITLNVPLYAWPVGLVLRRLLTDPVLWASLLLAALGGFVFWQRPGDWAARSLLLFSICMLVARSSSAVVEWSLPELFTPWILPAAVFCSNWIFATVMFPSLLLLTLVFPRPRPFVRRYLLPVLLVLYGTVPSLTVMFGQIATIGWVSVLAMALLSLVSLAYAFFTVRDPVGRAQMRWAASGLAVMVVGIIPINLNGLGWLPLPFPDWLEQIWFPAMLSMMALGFGIAILRYRLFDIDILINRALVYGTLTAGVIGLYVFVIGYLSTIFRVEGHLLISLAATGAVAVLFQPARGWLQRNVNRLMYGQRDEPVAVLSQLGRRLETTSAPEALLTGLAETVAQALKLPYAAITLKQPNDDNLTAAAVGNPTGQTHCLPLVYQAEIVGELVVAPRTPGEPFNAADRLLLETIAHQAGAAAHAVRLTAALQQSRRQLVTAREEERRRLRRDLHDGLGPHLASQTLTIDAITRLLERDPATARELLAQLKAQSQAAIDDIRRLVYNLRPPALDELGLVAALSESLAEYRQGGLQLELAAVPDPLPPLPAAVEVAAYRIIHEAVTNVARHAQAGHCTVQLRLALARLEITVADDGCGLPDRRRAGVGLTSMRERAEELGGTLTIEPGASGGTRVIAHLPVGG